MVTLVSAVAQILSGFCKWSGQTELSCLIILPTITGANLRIDHVHAYIGLLKVLFTCNSIQCIECHFKKWQVVT